MNKEQFLLTGAQKRAMADLAKAFEECRRQNIQFFITDGENALMAYNSTNFDGVPTTGDNLSGEWQAVDGKYKFVASTKKERDNWLEIPVADCDKILGDTLGIDFVSWGCCSGGLYALRKPCSAEDNDRGTGREIATIGIE